MIHARIQEFSSGGGVGVQVHLAYKKSSDNVFFFIFILFSPPLILQKSKKTIICQGSSGFGTFSRGGSNFSQGVQLLFPYKNPYNL